MFARIFSIILIFIFISLFFVFKSGLDLDPHVLPSVRINQALPEFHLADLFNRQQVIQKSDLLGRKTIINIWASWCEACLTEHALLMQLSKQYAHLQWVGINYRDDITRAKQWLDTHGNPYQKNAADTTGTFMIDLGGYVTPETFLINEQGIILFRHVGPLTIDVWQNEFLTRLNQ